MVAVPLKTLIGWQNLMAGAAMNCADLALVQKASDEMVDLIEEQTAARLRDYWGRS